jgi:GDP/UDP-N,N'-diacetylbacillosamine 2-epimerase (hydrolysing)
MRHIIAAVERCGLAGVAIYPNSDPGHSGIVRIIEKVKKSKRWNVFKSLPRDDYLRLLSRAAVLVGNSSSGIIESASIGVRTVNVGPRQAGRLRCGPHVVEAGESTAALVRAIRRALRHPPPRPGRSVYGDGCAGLRIAKVLERLIIQPALLHKQITY